MPTRKQIIPALLTILTLLTIAVLAIQSEAHEARLLQTRTQIFAHGLRGTYKATQKCNTDSVNNNYITVRSRKGCVIKINTATLNWVSVTTTKAYQWKIVDTNKSGSQSNSTHARHRVFHIPAAKSTAAWIGKRTQLNLVFGSDKQN